MNWFVFCQNILLFGTLTLFELLELECKVFTAFFIWVSFAYTDQLLDSGERDGTNFILLQHFHTLKNTKTFFVVLHPRWLLSVFKRRTNVITKLLLDQVYQPVKTVIDWILILYYFWFYVRPYYCNLPQTSIGFGFTWYYHCKVNWLTHWVSQPRATHTREWK